MWRTRGVLCLAIACVFCTGGCDAIRGLIVGQAVEPRLAGPFLNAPDVTQITESTPDRVTTGASSIHFLWTHPDASEVVPYQCKIVATNVENIPPNFEVGNVGGTSTANTIGGQIQFAMSPGTLLPGTYRAEISLQGQQFGTVDFEVHGN